MVGPWMRCGNGQGPGGRHHGWPMDALRERTGSEWTLSWLGHGGSANTDTVRVDVIMVGKYRANPTKPTQPPGKLGTRLLLLLLPPTDRVVLVITLVVVAIKGVATMVIMFIAAIVIAMMTVTWTTTTTRAQHRRRRVRRRRTRRATTMPASAAMTATATTNVTDADSFL